MPGDHRFVASEQLDHLRLREPHRVPLDPHIETYLPIGRTIEDDLPAGTFGNAAHAVTFPSPSVPPSHPLEFGNQGAAVGGLLSRRSWDFKRGSRGGRGSRGTCGELLTDTRKCLQFATWSSFLIANGSSKSPAAKAGWPRATSLRPSSIGVLPLTSFGSQADRGRRSRDHRQRAGAFSGKWGTWDGS